MAAFLWPMGQEFGERLSTSSFIPSFFEIKESAGA
jgi:hypothetical protein